MRYRKLILILGVIAVLFIGGGLLYNSLSDHMKNSSDRTDTASSLTVPPSIDITAAAEITGTGATDAAATSSGATASGSTASGNTPSASSSGTSAANSADTAASTAPAEGLAVGNLAYDFTLKDYDGNDVKLSDYRGKIVILNFWASWCGPCREEMPDFQKIQNDITAEGANADTVILAVNMTDGQYETKDTARGYMKDQGYTYPLVFDDGSVSSLYQIYYIPDTFILNKDGIIIKVIEGSTDLETLNAAVNEARG